MVAITKLKNVEIHLELESGETVTVSLPAEQISLDWNAAGAIVKAINALRKDAH